MVLSSMAADGCPMVGQDPVRFLLFFLCGD